MVTDQYVAPFIPYHTILKSLRVECVCARGVCGVCLCPVVCMCCMWCACGVCAQKNRKQIKTLTFHLVQEADQKTAD